MLEHMKFMVVIQGLVGIWKPLKRTHINQIGKTVCIYYKTFCGFEHSFSKSTLNKFRACRY